MAASASGWLSTGQVASRLGLSPDTIRRYGLIGRLREYRTPGGHRRFRVEDVDALTDGVTEVGGEAPPRALPTERASPGERPSARASEENDVELWAADEPTLPSPWEQRVLEAQADVEALKAQRELEALTQARRRRNDVRSEKATATAAAAREALRLTNLKSHGRIHANRAGVPQVWRAKVGRTLEHYVTAEQFPPGLRNAEANALVRDKVDEVLGPYREERAEAREDAAEAREDAAEAREDLLRVERLIRHGKSRSVTSTIPWDLSTRGETRRAVEQALEEEVEADWTEADVSELVDQVLEESEEEDY